MSHVTGSAHRATLTLSFSISQGGRTALMLSLLHQHLQITHWMIQQVAEECINARDNVSHNNTGDRYTNT